MSGAGGRRGGWRPSEGDFPAMAARGRGGSWTKKPGQAAGRGQWAPGSSSSNAPPTTAPQAWNGNGGPSRPLGNNWAQPSHRRPTTRDNPRPPLQTNPRESERQAVPNLVVPPPLENGWQWRSRPSGPESDKVDVPSSSFDPEMDSSDVEYSSDDDMSDEYDSDASEKSFETRKTNKWFKGFFEDISALTEEQLREQDRHCPACQKGPGAIDWFKGLHSLLTHARTKGSRRVKLHREFAALLEEEISSRGTTVVPSGEQFGKWAGLRGGADREIVWPPMVIVMNTLLEQDENEKWLGMGNPELLDYFSDYEAIKARHSYSPIGHRGMSVLIFESSAVGYMEAERLHKHFVDQNTDREAWQAKKARFLPGGKRQLYGFLAKKEDMEDFNKHHQGKSRLKYDMRSHNEMVVAQLKQMGEENQQLHFMKNRMVKTEQYKEVIEVSFGVITQKYREVMEDKRVLIHRVGEKHLEHEEEMKSQDNFFNYQIQNIQKAMEEQRAESENLLREQRAESEKLLQEQGAKYEKLLQEQRAEFEKLLQEERAKAG